MPYTPPSQRSPASTTNNTPILSRNHSYSNDLPGSSPLSAYRPVLPRSISSTSYLQKHRRTPSISQSNGSHPTHNGLTLVTDTQARNHTAASTNGSLRQSPPPLNNLLIPSGAITTPPDSSQGSDDEDRGRQLASLVELQDALQSIELKRGHSPNREDGTKSAPESSAPPVRPALTPEARKISHSRSSSEIQLSSLNPKLQHSPVQISDDSDADEEDLQMKPPLLRKKSGELVKPALRPSSRRRPSSMPGTPTFSKAVHFNEDIEQVRHFLQVDRPIAVSAGSSPVETYDSESEYPFGYDDGYASRKVEWELRLANFPRDSFERKALPVRVERIFLSADTKTLIGNVAVANLAFNKAVVARFTLDYWKTTSEVTAEYNNDIRKKQSNDGYDRFNFNIKLADQAHLETKTLLLSVRYNVNGQEFWDNNNSMNFQVDFIKKTPPKNARSGKHGLNVGSLGAIPRSRHSPPGPRPRSMPVSFDDDFGHDFDSKYQFGSTRSLIGESPNNTIRFKNNNKRGSIYPGQPQSNNSAAQAFSTRYDFGASLSAALQNAQNAMGDKSGLQPKVPAKQKAAPIVKQPVTEPSAPKSSAPAVGGNEPRPDALSSKTTDLKSAEYNELIQKFCFFGSGSGNLTPSNTPSKPAENDGANDSSGSSSGSNQSSASNSPPSPIADFSGMMDGTNEYKRAPSPFLSRSASPGPLTGSDIGDRTTSPLHFGYPYNQNITRGIFSEPHTPQAIRG